MNLNHRRAVQCSAWPSRALRGNERQVWEINPTLSRSGNRTLHSEGRDHSLPKSEQAPERKRSEANMYDLAHPGLIGTRNVIAAWLVCLAVGVATFVFSGPFPEPAREAQAALASAAPSVSRTELCAVRSGQVAAPHG